MNMKNLIWWIWVQCCCLLKWDAPYSLPPLPSPPPPPLFFFPPAIYIPGAEEEAEANGELGGSEPGKIRVSEGARRLPALAAAPAPWRRRIFVGTPHSTGIHTIRA